MSRATAAFASASTVSWPPQQAMPESGSVQLELITVFVAAFGFAQPDAATYQSGSPEASNTFGRPNVRHGSLPTAGTVQLPAAMPSFAVPMLPAASGQGMLPGSFSPEIAAWWAT